MIAQSCKYLCALVGALCLLAVAFSVAEAHESMARAASVGSAITQPSLALTDHEKAWLHQHETVSVAFDGYFPPYSFLTANGEIQGLAVDILKLVAERAGIKIVIAQQTVWKDLYAAAQRREVDVVATMGARPERKQWFAFTPPYIFKPLVIVTSKENQDIKTPADLAGKRIALVRGYQYVKSLLATYPTIKPHYVDIVLDGLDAVATGDADAVISFLGVSHYLIDRYQLSNLKFAAIYDRDQFTESICVRGDWPELASIFTKALASISETERATIDQRWIAAKPHLGIDHRTFFIYLALILAVVLGVITLFVAWNRALRKLVWQRTAALSHELAERQEVERALRVSEERFKAMFNAANDAFFVHDIDTGEILDVNSKVCEMYGWSREEILAMDVGDLSSGAPPYSQTEAAIWMQKAATGKAQLFEWQGRNRAGNCFWLEINMHRATIGDVDRIIATARDIGERKKADSALRKAFYQRKELELIINKSQAVAFTWRAEQGWPVEFVSKNIEQWGYAAEDFINGEIVYGDLIHRDDLARVVAEVADYSAAGVSELKQEYRLITKSGEIIWTDDVTWVRRDQNGQITHYQGLVLDVTDKKKAQEELLAHKINLESLVEERTAALDKSRLALINLVEDLNKANEKLKEVDRLKSMFIASMSHELRTPLNSVIGFSSILLNEWTGPLNDEQKQNVSSVLRSGKHLLSLINDVIDISKVEAGMIEADCTEFDLADLLDEVEQTIIKQAQDAGLVLTVDKLHALLTTDRRRLLQCVLNLVSNAVKYTEAGEVMVRVQQDATQENVVIAVTDSGIGIALADQPKLFRAFSRIQSPLSTSVLGTGLGLYLTKKIGTEILHGQLSVTSELGKGSTFVLSVPCTLSDK